MPHSCAAAHGLAGFGAADLDDMAPRRLPAEVMIEGEDAMDLGAGPVYRNGQPARCFIGHEAAQMLHMVEHLDQVFRAIAMRLRDRLDVGA